MAATCIMAGIYSSPSPSPYPIEKIGDFPYPYSVNAEISIKTRTDSDNININRFICRSLNKGIMKEKKKRNDIIDCEEKGKTHKYIETMHVQQRVHVRSNRLNEPNRYIS